MSKTFFLLFFISAGISQVASAKQIIKKIDSLEALLKNSEKHSSRFFISDTDKVKIMNSLSGELQDKREYDKAIVFATDALILSRKNKFDYGEATALCSIGFCERKKHNLNEALEKYFASLEIRMKYSDSIGIAQLYNNISDIYGAQGRYQEAMNISTKAISISLGTASKKTIADSYFGIGIIYHHIGNYPQALKNQLVALQIREETGDKKSLANSYLKIGNIYLYQSNYADALRNYLFAKTIAEQTDDKYDIGGILNSIGLVYNGQGKYSEALKYYDSCLQIFQEIGEKNDIATVYMNVGEVNLSQGHYNTAMKVFHKALSIVRRSGIKARVAVCLMNLGEISTRLGRYFDAKQYLNEALSISKATGNKNDIRDCYEKLTNLETVTENWKNAFESYRWYNLYRDSLSNEENLKKSVQVQMQYEFDKKESNTKSAQAKKDALAKVKLEKQKSLLNSIITGSGVFLLSVVLSFIFYKRKRDAEQRQKEMAMRLQISETELKALRSQMNPHFLFNALSSIQSFLVNNQPGDADNYLLKFKELVRRVLENSMLAEITLQEDLKTLELYMQLENIRLDFPFTFQFDIEEQIDQQQVHIPPLILQPFVENAIWHGLQPKAEAGGHICISVYQKRSNFLYVVEDNGVGRKSNKVNDELSSLFKKNSLGIKLTEERLKIINEQRNTNAYFNIVDLFTNENKPCGTRVELTLPVDL